MRVTMEDIARMAGVSKATVSRVVNGIEQGVGPETRRRVLQIVKETNYRSYSLPSQNQSKTLGLIIPDIINPFFGELVKAIEGEATEQGYTVLLGNTDFSMEKEERYLSIFLAKRVDGIILVTTAQTAGEHYQRLKKYSVPCVLVDRMLAGAEYTAGIFVDNSYALFMACSLLIQHRNEKIALISGPRNISTSVERIQATGMRWSSTGCRLRSGSLNMATTPLKADTGPSWSWSGRAPALPESWRPMIPWRWAPLRRSRS